jgi:hypothetical protein
MNLHLDSKHLVSIVQISNEQATIGWALCSQSDANNLIALVLVRSMWAEDSFLESGRISTYKESEAMLLAVVIAKSLIELSLMFIVGRFLLGLLAGPKRDSNVFWQLLDVASKPALWLTRRISPKLILDQHIPLATGSWLLIAWVFLVQTKIDICLSMGVGACQ